MYLEPPRSIAAAEDPVTGVRSAFFYAAALVLVWDHRVPLWFLQVLSGDEYVALANDNRVRSVSVPAPRGVIDDCNGQVLVKNRAGLSVGVLPTDLPDEAEAEVLPKLADVLGLSLPAVEAKVAKARAEDPYRVVVLAEDVSETPTVAYLKEHSLEFPGVRVQKSYCGSILTGHLQRTFWDTL